MLSPASDLTSTRRSRGSLRALAPLLVALVAVAATLVQAASAAAATAAPCNAGTLSKPFLKWGDENLYTLIPGGHFEAGEAAWSMTGGARLVAGAEPWAVTGSLGKYSLSIPPGGSAESPFICVTPEDRTFRFFDRSESTSGNLLASVVFETPAGTVLKKLSSVSVASGWAPSAILHTGAAVAASILGEEHVYLALEFESVKGTTRVDDVFLDPRHH